MDITEKEKPKEASPFYLFIAPFFLFFSLLILSLKLLLLGQSPLWMTGLALSISLSTLILFLSFKELKAQKEIQRQYLEQKAKETSDLHALLDEANYVYRSRTDRIETEAKKSETALQELQHNFEEHVANAEAQIFSLTQSLEEALSEVQHERQKAFLLEEKLKTTPTDIDHKYKQLRDQFEEKSKLFDKARQDLFDLQGELIQLQKAEQFDKKESSCALEAELTAQILELQDEVEALEELLSAHWKKSANRKKSKALEEMLELQFENLNS